ncbi:Transcription initiation factor TFIID subunit 9 [Malassezia vespertilionis]|nr:Transcription initiation factor TFIID subunit 9 [Malassezia vespertilionis]WFD07536.1 Transcription initiation factor TFIID subunit 9 [Malassezia vespertilionis]
MGIEDAEPAVLVQLMEFANRAHVLQDALVYADHSAARQGGNNVSIDDVQLAVQSRVNYSFSQPPPKEMILSLASSLNSVPLPPVSNRHGIRLPPPEHCLTNVNFSIVPNAPQTNFGDSVVQPDVAKDAHDLQGDTTMDDVTESMELGTKRALDEDEDYD